MIESLDAAGGEAELPAEPFGPYEILREIGRGGMATVFLARDRKHERDVAVKILAAELVAGLGAERFLREIEIAAHLTHPHILPLIDSGVADGRPYYIMPYIEGESLRDRLARERRLSVEDALRIAEEVGEAIAYAHDRGVVHRDVKPGNILLTDGGAVVADFGIAMALDQAGEGHLTRTGQSVGTVGYMSPEQASGDHDVDARSDQYSLAAVLFEMLTGETPFTGRTARAVLGQQLSQTAPRAAARREGIPDAVDGAVARALARDPEDRYPTAKEFVDDLRAGIASARTRRRPGGAEATGAGVVLLLAVLGAWLIPTLRTERAGSHVEMADIDPARYAVFPFVSSLGDSLAVGETQRLEDALNRWDGIGVVYGVQLRDAVERAGTAGLTLGEAARVAAAQGAGRFITGRVDRLGDSVRVQASLYGIGGDGPVLIQSGAARFGAEMSGADASLADLAASLLFGGEPPPDARPGVGTESYPARLEFESGMRALEDWQLAVADSAFTRATEIDPDYAEAHLWTAFVRAWSGAAEATWRIPVAQALLHGDRLAPRDSLMGAAMERQVRGELPEACRRWRDLTVEHSADFPVWYGLALCLRSDRAVVRDPSSPSGWSFRSSYRQVILAYQRAFELLPSILESLHSDAYRSLRGVLMVSGSLLRQGRAAPPDTGLFVASPAWVGDTLGFVPRRFPGPQGMGDAVDLPAYSRAIEQQRIMFREVAAAWVAASPRNARAREAMSVALSLLGDRSALDTLLSGRRLARTPDERRDLAVAEVWLRVALSLPGDSVGLLRARRLADSLLVRSEDALDPASGAGLAMLLGRAEVAARFARDIPPDGGMSLMPAGQADARALLAFATLQGPRDSLVRLERQVLTALQRISPEARESEQLAWLAVPASLAFPAYRFETAPRLDDWVVSAQQHVLAGDTAAVLERFSREGAVRAQLPPYISTFDALLPESEILVALGHDREAAQWMDPTLSSLLQVEPNRLATLQEAGGLVRLAALRAGIARRLGDERDAAAWASAVAILWSTAGPEAQKTVGRMRRIMP